MHRSWPVFGALGKSKLEASHASGAVEKLGLWRVAIWLLEDKLPSTSPLQALHHAATSVIYGQDIGRLALQAW